MIHFVCEKLILLLKRHRIDPAQMRKLELKTGGPREGSNCRRSPKKTAANSTRL